MSETKPATASKAMPRITAALGVVVAINTMVYSCSDQHKRERSEVVASEAEHEKIWNEANIAFDALLKDRPVEGNGQAAQNWSERCKLLGTRYVHLPSSIDESGTQDDLDRKRFPAANALHKRAVVLAMEFEDNIGDAVLVGQICAENFRRQEQLANRQTASEVPNPPADRPPSPHATSTPAPQAAPFEKSLRTITVNRAPVFAGGYDIDVFWCDRSDGTKAQLNFNGAGNFVRQLASKADTASKVANQRLGRIRLRPLSLQSQTIVNRKAEETIGGALAIPQYPTSGIAIRYDESDATEKAMAEAMLGLAKVGEAESQAFQSQWYLSAFFCAH